MFKNKPILFTIGLLALLISLSSCTTPREDRYPDASIRTLTEAEMGWYAAGITYYHLVVEISFADERRLHSVTVKDQKILEGTVVYWDPALQGWGEPMPMNEEEAYWYTVPGLFETIRRAVLQECRSFIRNDLSGTPPFPHVIILGPPEEDGEPIEEIVSWVEVREFISLMEDEG